MDLDRNRIGIASHGVISSELDSCNLNSLATCQLLSLSSQLKSFRHDGTLCDTSVLVDGKSFQAHKVILAAMSDVFRALFTCGLKESNQSEIVLQDDTDLSAEGFEILLEFAYSADLRLTVDNVFEVLASAHHLHVQQATEGCINYISECFENDKLVFDDYLKISSMAANYHLDRLKTVADNHIARNFGEVSLTEDFVEHMSAHNLGQFLTRDDLAVSSEVQILQAVVRWIHYDLNNRIHHATSIIKKVRLGLIHSHNIMEEMDSNILAVPQCKAIFDQLMQHFALHSPTAGQLVRQHPEFFAPRVSTKSLLAIGGQTTLGFARYFNHDKHEWIPLKMFAELHFSDITDHSVIAVAGKLFLVGGVYTLQQRSHTQNLFYSYDISDNKWTRLPAMKVERSHVALTHFNGFIYAIGGKDEKGNWLQSVERYDMSRGKWQTAAAMATEVSGMFPSAVAYNEMIFVSSTSTEGIQNLIYFNPDTNSWTTCDRIETSTPGRLVKIDATCLIVSSRTVPSKLGKKQQWDYCPVVNDIMTVDGHTKISQVTCHDQSMVPESYLHPFCVDGHVYLLVNGACLDSKLDIQPDQVYDIELDLWSKLNQNIEGAAITECTFNIQQLTCM